MQRWRRWRTRIDAFFFGAALSWLSVPYQVRKRVELERLFVVMATLQLWGIPLAPPGRRLQMLPYLMPNLLYWRRMSTFDHAIDGADVKHLGH